MSCSLAFASGKDLHRHELSIHSDTRPYVCPIVTCPRHKKGWPREDNRNRHFKTMLANENSQVVTGSSLTEIDSCGNALAKKRKRENDHRRVRPEQEVTGNSSTPSSLESEVLELRAERAKWTMAEAELTKYKERYRELEERYVKMERRYEEREQRYEEREKRYEERECRYQESEKKNSSGK